MENSIFSSPNNYDFNFCQQIIPLNKPYTLNKIPITKRCCENVSESTSVKINSTPILK